MTVHRYVIRYRDPNTGTLERTVVTAPDPSTAFDHLERRLRAPLSYADAWKEAQR